MSVVDFKYRNNTNSIQTTKIKQKIACKTTAEKNGGTKSKHNNKSTLKIVNKPQRLAITKATLRSK